MLRLFRGSFGQRCCCPLSLAPEPNLLLLPRTIFRVGTWVLGGTYSIPSHHSAAPTPAGIQRRVTVEEREATTAVPVFVKRQRGPGLCTPAQEWW